MSDFELSDCEHFVLNFSPHDSNFINSSLAHQLNITNYDDLVKKFVTLYSACQEVLGSSDGQDVDEPVLSSCSVGFREEYGALHGYIALIICIFGSFANAINFIILTRKEMVNSTNTILTGLACVDFWLLVEYIGFASWYIMGKGMFIHYYYHAVYIMFHAYFTQITHTVSICLAITLAVWRYIAICKPHLNLVLCTLPKSRVAVMVAYLASLFITAPNLFLYEIQDVHDRETNLTSYYVNFSDSSKSHTLLTTVYFYVYGFLVKLIPCFLLTFFIYKIIRAMYIAKKRKANLLKNNNPSPTGSEIVRKIPQMEKLTEKTTTMLLSVLLLFLVVELPQGILTLLSAIHGKVFFEKCYMEWGDIMDLMALLNSSVNFFLYYIMSQQFRITLKKLFALKKARPVVQRCKVHETVSTLV